MRQQLLVAKGLSLQLEKSYMSHKRLYIACSQSIHSFGLKYASQSNWLSLGLQRAVQFSGTRLLQCPQWERRRSILPDADQMGGSPVLGHPSVRDEGLLPEQPIFGLEKLDDKRDHSRLLCKSSILPSSGGRVGWQSRPAHSIRC